MKRIPKLKSILIINFLLIASIGSKAYAEQINAFRTDIKINTDGTVDVLETIEYDFGANAVNRHGIIRDIPLTKENQDGKTFFMDMSKVNVLSHKFSQTTTSNDTSIKIGDANITVTGANTYRISYRLSGALSYFIDNDELYWNATGNEWEVPIKYANVNIFFPDTVNINDIVAACYTGGYGTNTKNCSTIRYDNFVRVETSNVLGPGEGLTIGVGFPKGNVAELLPREDKMTLLEKIMAAMMAIVILSVVLGWYVIVPVLVFIVAQRNHKFHKLHERIVAAWFEPPKHKDGEQFIPAETSTIVDNGTGNKAISATIIHLAQKGFMKIHVKEKNKITFEKITEPPNKEISRQERKIYDAIFSKEDLIDLNKLKKDIKFYNAITEFKTSIPARLYDKGMYEKRLSNSRTKQGILMMFAFLTGNIPLFILTILLKNRLIRRKLLGIEKYSEAVSLKNFLVSQDEQLDFQAEKQLFFEKLLPYATAFGVEDVWIKKFGNLELNNSEWYDGNLANGMALSTLTNRINSTVNSSTSYAAGTRSSSGFSSGSSGGGFSGGGGGGGGGSSW